MEPMPDPTVELRSNPGTPGGPEDAFLQVRHDGMAIPNLASHQRWLGAGHTTQILASE
jgi:hypothetical protein